MVMVLLRVTPSASSQTYSANTQPLKDVNLARAEAPPSLPTATAAMPSTSPKKLRLLPSHFALGSALAFAFASALALGFRLGLRLRLGLWPWPSAWRSLVALVFLALASGVIDS